MTERFLTLHEFVIEARSKLPDTTWAYIMGGTETESTVRRNRQALDSLALRPRVLNDVSSVDCTARLFGVSSRLPVFLCPIGGLEAMDPGGALGVATAAESFGVPMLLSSVSTWSPADLLEQTGDDLSLIYQLYAREDALLAIEHGIDTIYVSNHGGRQLDHAIGSTTALIDIVEAVDSRASVLVDGGFSRGTDIAKAIALGADGVGLGRLMCYALAAGGSAGIERMLTLLEEEYRIALGLLGVQSGAQLNHSYVQEVDALHHETALLSAFPLLKDEDF